MLMLFMQLHLNYKKKQTNELHWLPHNEWMWKWEQKDRVFQTINCDKIFIIPLLLLLFGLGLAIGTQFYEVKYEIVFFYVCMCVCAYVCFHFGFYAYWKPHNLENIHIRTVNALRINTHTHSVFAPSKSRSASEIKCYFHTSMNCMNIH